MGTGKQESETVIHKIALLIQIKVIKKLILLDYHKFNAWILISLIFLHLIPANKFLFRQLFHLFRQPLKLFRQLFGLFRQLSQLFREVSQLLQ